MEAATLTLEEAGSVLEHAYGPDHPEVQALREQLAAMVEPEEEEDDDDGGGDAAGAAGALPLPPEQPLPSSRQVRLTAEHRPFVSRADLPC